MATNGHGVAPAGDESYLGTRYRSWLHSPVKVLKATELYILKRLILCYMNFISIKKKFKISNKS